MRDLLVDALATYRLARLVTTDTLPPVLKAREAFVERHTAEEHPHEPDAWAELVQCQWCASWWVALGVLAARALFPRAWDVAARGLAFSAAAGLLSAAASD